MDTEEDLSGLALMENLADLALQLIKLTDDRIMSEPRYLSGDDYALNGGYEELINCNKCGTEFDRTQYKSETCSACEDKEMEGIKI